jgi:hypothetical protein
MLGWACYDRKGWYIVALVQSLPSSLFSFSVGLAAVTRYIEHFILYSSYTDLQCVSMKNLSRLVIL